MISISVPQVRDFIQPKPTVAVHHQNISVYNFGSQNSGRQIWVCTASNTSIVKLPRRRADTARALVNVKATDAAHKGSAELALHHLL